MLLFAAPATTDSISISLITALQNAFKLTDGQIDLSIKEEDFFYLGGLFGAWNRYAGNPGLQLNEGQQHTISANPNFIDNQMKMKASLEVWKRHYPLTATFRNLLNIVLNLNEVGVAKSICQYLSNI